MKVQLKVIVSWLIIPIALLITGCIYLEEHGLPKQHHLNKGGIPTYTSLIYQLCI